MSQQLTLIARPPEATLEQSLRELLSNAPYLGVALALHLLVLLVFLNLTVELPELEVGTIVQASVPPAPPEVVTIPDPVEPPEFMDPTATFSEDPLPTEVSAEPTLLPSDLPPSNALSASMGVDSVLGLGSGPAGDFGGGGRGGHGTHHPGEPNVQAGLAWLAAHQDPAGFWSANGFEDQCGVLGADGPCGGRGSPRFDVGVTGLALLAFLGAGHTDRHGDYKAVVKDGLRYLRDIQASDGSMESPRSSQGTYDHIIATLALCDAYHYSRSHKLRGPAEAALAHMYELRTPGSGWRYGPDHETAAIPGQSADTSVTGWAMLAMAEAKRAGLRFEPAAMEDALLFLDEMTSRDTGRTGYVHPGGNSAREDGLEVVFPAEQSEAMTAVALLSRIFADPDLARPGHRELIEKGADLLAALPPIWDDDRPGRRDYYYWYYGTYALYQVGGKRWRQWEAAIIESIAKHQHRDGERTGSWDPQLDPWGHLGGRVYSTALLTLTLEVFYRYETVMGG